LIRFGSEFEGSGFDSMGSIGDAFSSDDQEEVIDDVGDLGWL
jgi:hypothetical protein